MSQIKCPGCDTPIPYGGNACPMCGAKVSNANNSYTPTIIASPPTVQTITEIHHHHQSTPSQPVLIEQTGKKWKKLYLVAWAFIFFGIMACSAGGNGTHVSGFFWLAGIVVYIYARTGAWWHHG